MDRLDCMLSRRGLAIAFMGLFLGTAGCRSTRNEVPPGKPYATTGGQPPSVGFSSDPHPAQGTFAAPGSLMAAPGGLTRDGNSQQAGYNSPTYGTPTTGNSSLQIPTSNRYGPPGSTGLDPTAGPNTPGLADTLLKANSGTQNALKDERVP